MTQPDGDPWAGRRLRIGYVSPDFREHVMGFYSEPVLAAHNRNLFEIFAYAPVPQPDALTRRIQGLVDHWRPIAGRSDAQVAEWVRQDRIDILIDLAGHTGGHRLLVFARKPAPIQATHFGYMGTTGLPTVDYRITDAHVDPPGLTERFHTEELVRLPHAGWCYWPGATADVKPLPALAAGRVTFGSFNNLAKVTSRVIEQWSRILHAVEGSRLLILTGVGRGAEQRLADLFARQGIPPERLLAAGRRSRAAYFRLFHAVDISLDPFPYTGCNTTCDSLWMGVPTVTLAGKTPSARHSVTPLRCLGLQDLIDDTADAYVEIVVRLARDLPRLGGLRAELRERMQHSPLADVAGFTRQLEQAYRDMWQRFVRSRSANHMGGDCRSAEQP